MHLYSIDGSESVTSHGANSDRIITITKPGSTGPFRVRYALYNTSSTTAIRTGSYTLGNSSSDSYTPLYSAIKHRFIMIAAQDSGSYYISTFYNNSVLYQDTQVSQTHAIAIKSDKYSSEAKIYNSYNRSSSYYLAKRTSTSTSIVTLNQIKYIGSSNCANLIEVEDNIVAVS